jgi:hypothetical protein
MKGALQIPSCYFVAVDCHLHRPALVNKSSRRGSRPAELANYIFPFSRQPWRRPGPSISTVYFDRKVQSTVFASFNQVADTLQCCSDVGAYYSGVVMTQ